jgi:hypothetical protein
MAKKLGMSANTLIKHCDHLVELGLIIEHGDRNTIQQVEVVVPGRPLKEKPTATTAPNVETGNAEDGDQGVAEYWLKSFCSSLSRSWRIFSEYPPRNKNFLTRAKDWKVQSFHAWHKCDPLLIKYSVMRSSTAPVEE